ncbi:efflux RND transporter periplasmic adaptor subunit [Dokdonella ginsengisoli]|uniref:Efflux RND transporter periplasmic adaptor subunit n=1 Tax=Dokdonella ginsengisoli TaxID=363846 RepID=A0ABV9QSS5_9GAMM
MSRWKTALVLLVLAALAVLGWRLLHRPGASAPGMHGGAGGADAPIPVTVVPVEQKDVPVYLTALGTVQALNTVTVSSQVTGQLKALHFAEGDEIQQGALIAEIDPRTFQAAVDQAVAKKNQDAAQLSASRSTLKRYEELIVKHFVSAQDLENQRQTVRQQEALVAADDAAISSARTQLGYTRITAPITGIAGIRQVDVGNLVTANSSTGIVTLTQVHPINVIFTLPEQNLGEVRNGQGAAALAVTALDRTDAHALGDGVLKVIDNQIDSSTGTFKLKSEFANENNALWPGQFVNVRLRIKTVSNGLVVPATALQRGPEGSYVYALQPDDTVAMKPVTPAGEAGDNGILIGSGVAAGDRVVTEGQFRLKPGSKVVALAPGQAAPQTSEAELSKLKEQDKGQPQRRGGRRGG